MHTQTLTQAIYVAWANIKVEASLVTNTHGERVVSNAEIALIEPGIRLLELSARYRAAHAAHVEAVAAENAAYKANVKAPIAATDAARSAMEAAKQALLSAALDIT